MPLPTRAIDILTFWFGAAGDADYGHYRKAWFVKDPDFDEQVRQRFLTDVEKAAAGDYDGWLESGEGGAQSAIALVLLLDQFPRNLYRGEPRSFATDSKALAVASELVDSGMHRALIPAQRFFVYVPFEHSENMVHQDRCVVLMSELNREFPDLDKGLKGGLDYALRHREIIERFGRFPHRNGILNRLSTPEEFAFLQQPGSRF